MLWQRCLLLLVILVIITIGASGNETKHHSEQSHNYHKSSGHSKSPQPGPNQLSPRKIDSPQNRQGLLAGPLFLGLSSLLFPVLPMLLLAPIAVAGIGPAVNFVKDGLGASGISSNSATSSGSAISESAISSALHNLAQSHPGISQALHSLAQRGSSATSGSQGSSSLSSLASSLSSGSGIQHQASASSNVPTVASPASISASVAQALGISDSAISSGDSNSILNGITNFFGPDRNSAAGSSSLTQTLLGNLGNRPSLLSGLTGKKPPAASLTGTGSSGAAAAASGGTSGASATPADYLGAAAAALDNAGLLGSISGSGTGSVTDRLLSLVTGNKNSQSSASGSSSIVSSSALADLLGLGSSSGGTGSSPSSSSSLSSGSGNAAAAAAGIASPASSASGSSSSPHAPLLGSSLSSNIIHNLPPSYGAALNNMKLVSAKPVSSSSGSIQSLANNALNKISSFIFSRRRSEWVPRPYPGFGYLDSTSSMIDSAGARVRSGVSSYVKDAYSVLKDGIKRYEVAEPECQARIVCELHQKPVGRSFKSWANTILEIAGVEQYLDSMKFGARTKSVMKDIYRAAKNGMIDQNCAEIYSKCPVSISTEPLKNTLINKMLRGSGHNLMMGYALSGQQSQQHQMKPNHENVAKVYGPFGSQAVTAQSRESVDVSSPAVAAAAPAQADKHHNNNNYQKQQSHQQSAVTSKQSTPRPSASSAAAVVANRPSSSSATTPSSTKNHAQSASEPTPSSASVNQKLKSRRSIGNARFSARFAS